MDVHASSAPPAVAGTVADKSKNHPPAIGGTVAGEPKKHSPALGGTVAGKSKKPRRYQSRLYYRGRRFKCVPEKEDECLQVLQDAYAKFQQGPEGDWSVWLAMHKAAVEPFTIKHGGLRVKGQRVAAGAKVVAKDPAVLAEPAAAGATVVANAPAVPAEPAAAGARVVAVGTNWKRIHPRAKSLARSVRRRITSKTNLARIVGVARGSTGGTGDECPALEPAESMPASAREPAMPASAPEPAKSMPDSVRDRVTFSVEKYIAGGSYGRIFKCLVARPAIPAAADPQLEESVVGDKDAVCLFVAVKVQEKTGEGATSTEAQKNEISILDELRGRRPGVVEMLSYTETTFDIQIVFTLHGGDLDGAIQMGSMTKKEGIDPLASVCQQLANGLAFVHSLGK